MEAYSHSFEYVINSYSFVKTARKRTDPDFIKDRLFEHNLMSTQRSAVQFCKNLHEIKTFNISKVSQDEKNNISTCLQEYFVNQDPNFFGKRDTIFIDLWD